MSSSIILYVGLVMAVLRAAVEIHEIVARKASHRRREQELHPAPARPPAAAPSATVPDACDPGATPGIPAVRPDDSPGMSAAPERGTGGTR